MERFDDICPENEFEDKNYNEEYDREYWLSGNLVGISINLCKSIQKELFINDTS